MEALEIKSYKKLKGNLYEVALGSGEKYKLYDDVILKYELLLDKNVDQKKLDRVLADNAQLDAYYKAIKYIGLKMRTEKELKKYLKKFDLSEKAISFAVQKLKGDGYLDQKKYVDAYVNDELNLRLNGPRRIKDDLLKLGIREDVIDERIKEIDNTIWKDRIEKILNKKVKTNRVGAALFKNKAYSDLSFMGYESSDIREVLDCFVLNTGDAFLKEADKLFNKLSCKYEGTELKLRFKSKMYAKGFDGEIISDYLDNLKN